MRPFDDAPVFSAPWEAEAFAMAVTLHERCVFSWNEWADTLGFEIKGHPRQSYYESWLAALEQLVEARNLMTHRERTDRIEAWSRAAEATPHGQPIELKNGSHHRA